MKRSFLLIALFLIAAFTVTGCRESQNAMTAENIDIDLQASELVDGTQVLILEILNDDGEEVPVEALSVRGDMNHAGMVPVIVEYDSPEDLEPFISTEPGVILVPFGWTMPGEWIVTVEATIPDEEGDGESIVASAEFTLDITEEMVVDEMDMEGMDMDDTNMDEMDMTEDDDMDADADESTESEDEEGDGE